MKLQEEFNDDSPTSSLPARRVGELPIFDSKKK